MTRDEQSHFVAGAKASLPLTCDGVAAVDLGFGATASCGLAIRRNGTVQCDALSFGACVNRLARLLESGVVHTLIVEAPLSGLFAANGDPTWWQPFERQQTEAGFDRRYWYTQPGSTVCLAAVAFFRHIGERVRATPVTIAVYEGFISSKSGKKSHCQDASRLIEAAGNSEIGSYYDVVPQDGESLLSILQVAGLTADSISAPAVITCGV